MKIDDLQEKTIKEETVLVACRIPISYKEFLMRNKISFSVFVKESLKELIENNSGVSRTKIRFTIKQNGTKR